MGPAPRPTCYRVPPGKSSSHTQKRPNHLHQRVSATAHPPASSGHRRPLRATRFTLRTRTDPSELSRRRSRYPVEIRGASDIEANSTHQVRRLELSPLMSRRGPQFNSVDRSMSRAHNVITNACGLPRPACWPSTRSRPAPTASRIRNLRFKEPATQNNPWPLRQVVSGAGIVRTRRSGVTHPTHRGTGMASSGWAIQEVQDAVAEPCDVSEFQGRGGVDALKRVLGPSDGDRR